MKIKGMVRHWYPGVPKDTEAGGRQVVLKETQPEGDLGRLRHFQLAVILPGRELVDGGHRERHYG